MIKLKFNTLAASVFALCAASANAAVVAPQVVDATHLAPNAVTASENINQQFRVMNADSTNVSHTGVEAIGAAKQHLELANHYTGSFVSLDVGTHYDNKDTTIGAQVGSDWGGYELTAGFVKGKYKTQGNGLLNPAEMVNQTTYNITVWKPFVSGETYDLSLGGNVSRTLFDHEDSEKYIAALDSDSEMANTAITSTYLALRARSTVSEQIGMYAEADYNVWNNHDRFSTMDDNDLHKPVTLKAGFDYTIVKGAQIGLNAVVGSKFDTTYTASFKYIFK
ncbi:hypothetical protein [Photobacterium damselae]|uniref:hypothetical protein n=1 Tax=Photobacterium damselae TaxID=38293 RepID=UPI001F41279B|nr:hypothetical protein [Photobacterium damselae]UKA04540.1 hypothetical protein IHC89_23240 [Photobacterium damselae subsp. damselae]